MSLRGVLVVCVLGALAAAVRADDFNVTVAAPWNCIGKDCKLRLVVTPLKDNNFHFSLEAEAKQYVAMAIAGSGMMVSKCF